MLHLVKAVVFCIVIITLWFIRIPRSSLAAQLTCAPIAVHGRSVPGPHSTVVCPHEPLTQLAHFHFTGSLHVTFVCCLLPIICRTCADLTTIVSLAVLELHKRLYLITDFCAFDHRRFAPLVSFQKTIKKSLKLNLAQSRDCQHWNYPHSNA